ncbi:unnamed protein product [Linum tenue]|uniref:Retrotransposon gag domain-containing protein n=1 Tax=Linum tenue TaxID=586396 RepID=A0AAV0ICG0_9ROSI|nr:unnamed protein product [Linum tenue]
MTHSQSGGLLPLDPELERTCRQLRRQQRARLAIEERIDDHLSSDSEEEYEMDGAQNPPQGMPLQVPPVNQILGNNPIPQADGVQHQPPPPDPTIEYYYTPRVADIRPFHGLKDEEARVHLSRFLQLTNGFKMNDVPDDAIRLHLFPHSLAEHAKRWLETQPPLSITSWDNLADKFVDRYYPLSKTTEIQWEITHLRQEPDESLRDAWERESEGDQVSMPGGDILTKTPPQLNQMISTLAARDHSWGQSTRSRSSQNRAMRESSTPQEQLAFIANARRLDPYSGTYNEGWRQHLNFSWNNSNTTKPPGFPAPGGGFQQRQPYQPRQLQPFPQPQRQYAEPQAAPAPDNQVSKLKNILAAFMTTSQVNFARMDQNIASLQAGQRNQGAILQDLQNQIGGIARQNNTRAPRTLPAPTVPNPREPHQQLNAITARSGKPMLQDPTSA